jgi:hypothetical protein
MAECVFESVRTTVPTWSAEVYRQTCEKCLAAEAQAQAATDRKIIATA